MEYANAQAGTRSIQGGQVQVGRDPVAAPPPQSVLGHIDVNDGLIVKAHELLNDLEKRLHLILGPPPSNAVGAGEAPESPMVTARLARQGAALDALCNRILSVMHRVEL
jgi:hypothetical protein